MHKSVALLVPLVACSAAIPLESRQVPQQPNGLPQNIGSAIGPAIGSLLASLAPSQKALSIENVPPTIQREGLKSIRMKYGPYKIRAGNGTEQVGNGRSMDPHGTGYTNLLQDFPKDITVLKTNSSMLYEDGSRADLTNGLYVHHIFASDGAKSNPAILQCPGNNPGAQIPISIFMATPESADNEPMIFTSRDGSYNSGYYIGKNDPISSVLDIVNYVNEEKTIYIVSDVQYVEGKIPDARETSQQIINLGMCSGASVSIRAPAGQTKFTLKSDTMTFTKGGRLLSMMAHLHDGGLSMTAEINGKQVCDSKAVYGGEGSTLGGMSGMMGGMGGMGGAGHDEGAGHEEGGDQESEAWETISSMTQCYDVDVKKGDTLVLEAFYDLDQHPARQHAMGGEAEEMAIMTFFFAGDP